MRRPIPHSELIRQLVGELRPVRPLRPPVVRAVGWLAAVFALGATLFFAGGRASHAMSAMADSSMIAAAATATLAAIAAFQLSLPDRRDSWILLPLPTLAMWAAVSGLGCLTIESDTASWGRTVGEAWQCFRFIVGISLPISLLAFIMLRRARPQRALRVSLLGGLASAAAAAVLLAIVHPHDSTALDLVAHAAALLVIVGVGSAAASRLISRENKSAGV